MNLKTADYLIILLYFVFVIAVGFIIKKKIKSSNDFLASSRSIPLWITSLAFISANLGAQEVIGMVASGAKYGIMTVHFYWVGAIFAMVFLGVSNRSGRPKLVFRQRPALGLHRTSRRLAHEILE